MSRWTIGWVACALLAAAGDAAADTKSLARAGSWEAFGGTTTGGRGVCGISAEPAGRYFGLKLFAAGKTFTIQMGTGEWKGRLEKGAKLPLTLRFDSNPLWRATGTVFIFDDGDPGLQFDVNRDEMGNFAREFRTSSQLVIQFENNQLPRWLMGLEGTAAVDSAFQGCTRTLQ